MTAIFDELLEEVFLITNRRDFVAETKSALKAATLKAHKTDFYSKDIHETGVEFGSSDFRQSLDYPALITNFRAFKYFRRVEDENDDTGIFIDIITVDEVLDAYGINKTDIAYVAGRTLEIRSLVEFKFALLGAYVLPIVREEDYISWVAEQFPFAIIYEAARVILTMIGKAEEARFYLSLTREAYQELRLAALNDVGY